MRDSISVASLNEERKEGKDASDKDDYYDGLDHEENQDASTHAKEHCKTEEAEQELSFAFGDTAVSSWPFAIRQQTPG